MKWHLWLALTVQMYLASTVAAVKFIRSSSLLTCMDDSQFTATNFAVKFFPENGTVNIDISALSTIPDDTYVVANVSLIAYGLNVLKQEFNFCSLNYPSICPFQPGKLDIKLDDFEVPESVTKQIPGIAYTIPDLDARVRVIIHSNASATPLACVEAVLSNGKTVQTKYASWPIAAISGLGVITSGVISVIGHSTTAAHIASNSMSLFIYFQSLAIISMQAVAKVPPIAAAWAQNFQWSLGIIKVDFVQKIANWYVQATGGKSTSVVDQPRLSVSVQKRSMGYVERLHDIYRRQLSDMHLTLFKRFDISIDTSSNAFDPKDSDLYTTSEKSDDLASKILVVQGIQRVAYLAGIEITSFFMTSIMFLLFFAFVMVVCLMFFKAIIEILIRAKVMNEGKFSEYRQQWGHIIKGSLYRLFLISLPQITVMCIWQFFERDSAGTVVFAVFLLIIWLALLLQAAVRVVMLGRQSVRQFKNPAYLLFGDGKFLNKFGFIYVQFRADKYWWITVSLAYIILKSLFVAVLQNNGKPQAIIVWLIELFYCIGVCWVRPFMDKRTNAFNIVIAVINTINALFFAFFSNVFTQPAVVSSVMAVVYFVLNAVFALFLLIFTIVTCVLALVYKNPDTRYQPMKDDRVSFLPRFTGKGAANAANDKGEYELTALGATAMKGHEHGPTVYRDDDSVSQRGPSQGKVAFQDDINSVADQDSYYMESIEPTQATSTITGSASAAGGAGYQGGHSAYTTPAYNPSSVYGGSQSSRPGGSAYNQSTGYTPRY
ncbi:flavin carrier protein 2 [Diutina catenulata]